MASGIHPLFNVSSLDKSVEFYKGLGLKAKVNSQQGMSWGEVWSGTQMLMLADKNQGPAAGDPWLDGELGKGVLVTIGVPDAKKTYAKAQALRATVEQELDDQPWGGKGFTLNDPDGYVVMFSDADWSEAEKPTKRSASKRPASRKTPRKGSRKATKKRAR